MATAMPEDRWESVMRTILKGGVVPHDPHHITAMLEMNGWNDQRAVDEFGYDDLFHMGEELFQQLQTRVVHQSHALGERIPWHRWVVMGLSYYLRGLMFAMPMVVSVVSMLTIEYSLWSSVEFGPEQATAIALGTIGSFMVTGGFTQAIARRGLFYISQKEWALARQTTFRIIQVGGAVAVAMAGIFLLINLVIPFFPWRLVWSIVPYYVFLSALWLAISVLYMLQKEFIFTAITAAGIAAVWYLYEYKHWLGIIEAQFLGLGTSTLISVIVGYRIFKQYEAKNDSGSGEVQMPRWSQVSRLLVPYFLFGFLYFSFLFLDRIIAWSVPGQMHPYPIWFLGDYELGLDWAILTLVVPMGLLELFINVFAKRIEYWQVATPGYKWQEFNRRFQSNYLFFVVAIFVISALGGWLIWLFVMQYRGLGLLDVDLFRNPNTGFVFVVATIAYVFVVLGVLNSLVLFSLNHPWPAVQSMGFSLLVNLIVGFLASRMIEEGYPYATIGLLVGSILFALISTREVYGVLGKLDYMLYRSV